MIEARVGPHRFRFPKSLYYDQNGPMGDGSFGLALEWPTLEPFAPGAKARGGLDALLRTVSIDLAYIDALPIEEFPGRYIRPFGFEANEPASNLSMRIESETPFGLYRYAPDFDRQFAYVRKTVGTGDIPGVQYDFYEDWYLDRPRGTRALTLIRCTPLQIEGTGIIEKEGAWQRDSGATAMPECHHSFTIVPLQLVVNIGYPRLALPEWKRIEHEVRRTVMNGLETHGANHG